MIVEKFGSGDVKEIEDPINYDSCIYCYAASKTCHFYREGDTHFLRVEGELREVTCMSKGGGSLSLACHPITEKEARKLLSTYRTYN
jgi:hypothetical protein